MYYNVCADKFFYQETCFHKKYQSGYCSLETGQKRRDAVFKQEKKVMRKYNQEQSDRINDNTAILHQQ